VALLIEARRPDARIFALSRHGLLPRSHGEVSPAGQSLGGAPAGSPRSVLAEIRRRAAIDWRGAIDGVRPHVQGIWRGWSLTERRRFLQLLRPWWNVYRHRLAPEVATEVETLRRDGLLTVAAGRVKRVSPVGEGVEILWTRRGETRAQTRRVERVINCTGASGVRPGTGGPLIDGLLTTGLVRPDACGLGVDVDARSRVIGRGGQANEALFAVGPLTRGQFYEITSVPDIRLQAADCADSILNVLTLRARAADGTPSGPAGAERLASDLAAFIEESIAELDVELGSLKFARRVRGAWELRGRRAALGEIALWLDARRGGETQP